MLDSYPDYSEQGEASSVGDVAQPLQARLSLLLLPSARSPVAVGRSRSVVGRRPRVSRREVAVALEMVDSGLPRSTRGTPAQPRLFA